MVRAVKPLQSHDLQFSSFCVFTIIPDGNCCQLQRYLLCVCRHAGCPTCPSGARADEHGAGTRGCADRALLLQQTRRCAAVGRQHVVCSPAQRVLKQGVLTRKGAPWFLLNARHAPGRVCKAARAGPGRGSARACGCVGSATKQLGRQPFAAALRLCCWCLGFPAACELPCAGGG